jgi:hypothetical protein
MTLIKTQNAMRRDSRDAGKRNSSFTDITSSPEYLDELSIKGKISSKEFIKSFVRLGIINDFVKSNPNIARKALLIAHGYIGRLTPHKPSRLDGRRIETFYLTGLSRLIDVKLNDAGGL